LNHLTAFVSWISKSPVSLVTSLKESLGLWTDRSSHCT
jgi:hypothetical protein